MSTAAPYSEDARKLVHMGVGVLALLLRSVVWWEAAVLASIAVAFNLYALPKLMAVVFRPHERTRHVYSGITLYPVAVLLLILTLPDRLDIVAGAWGILAFGDGMATIVGRRAGGPRIPWNPEKSVAGSAAFIVAGSAAGAFLCWWCRPAVVPPPFVWFSLGAPLAAAVAAAAVETVPIRLDDNLSVSATSAAVLWWASLIGQDLARTALSAAVAALPVALACNVTVAVAGYALGTVSRAGAIGGAILGLLVMISSGWRGWSLLLATFAVAVIASRLGLRRKTVLGIAEAHGGRRGVGNAIANTGVATAAAVLSPLTYANRAALVAFVAALAAGGSDTVASEIGKAFGRRTWLVPTLRPVPPGVSGGISIEGTVAGMAGAIALGALGVGLGLMPLSALGAVVLGATVASLAESAMGATLEAPGVLNNDALNFINTAIAAAVAVLLATGLE